MKNVEFIDALGELRASVMPSESKIRIFEKCLCCLYGDQHVTYGDRIKQM